MEGHRGARMALEGLLKVEARQCRQAHDAENGGDAGLGGGRHPLHRGRRGASTAK